MAQEALRALGWYVGTVQAELASVCVGPQVYDALALLLSRAGRHEEAVRMMQAAVEIDPTAPGQTGWSLHWDAWTVYQAANRVEELLRLYARQVEEYPGKERLLLKTADLFRSAGRFDEALQWLERVKRLPSGSDNPFLHLNLGLVYEAQGEAERAREAFKEALRLARWRGWDPVIETAEAALARLNSP